MSANASAGDAPPVVAVYGANGMHGAAIARALAAAGARVRLVGRDRERLEHTAATLPPTPRPATVHVARVDDDGALLAAFADAKVVVNAAGPFATVGDRVVDRAITARCHYLDLCAEQAVLRHVFERFDAAARRAEIAVVPGAGFAVTLGDLLAATATARLLGTSDEGPTVRDRAGPRLSSSQALSIAVGYLFDDLVLSPGAQASVFANLHAPMVVWRKDRWDPERAGRRTRTFNSGAPTPAELAAASGEAKEDLAPASREAFSLGGGDNITIPRHIAASNVDTYLSLSRKAPVHRALRLAAMAASLLPAAASSYLVPARPDPSAFATTRFAVVATAEHPFDARHAVAHGRDLYATSTAIACRLALALAERGSGPVGVLAPAEIVRAPALLAELAERGVLALR